MEQLGAPVAPTEPRPGCLAYELHRDPQNPTKFMPYERFRSQAALESTSASPCVSKLLSPTARL